jgi:hypothetical protein
MRGVIDDISEGLIDVAEVELLDELGHAADGMDLQRSRVDTGWGPVFIFRDRARHLAVCQEGSLCPAPEALI